LPTVSRSCSLSQGQGVLSLCCVSRSMWPGQRHQRYDGNQLFLSALVWIGIALNLPGAMPFYPLDPSSPRKCCASLCHLRTFSLRDVGKDTGEGTTTFPNTGKNGPVMQDYFTIALQPGANPM
jgi:hypothetical protein